MESYNLFLENYYDDLNEDYYEVISINKIPNGELKKHIKTLKIKNISTNNHKNTKYCSYVISTSILKNNNNKINICTSENINEIYEFLINNNYNINNELNKSLKLNNNLNIFNNKKLLFCVNFKN